MLKGAMGTPGKRKLVLLRGEENTSTKQQHEHNI